MRRLLSEQQTYWLLRSPGGWADQTGRPPAASGPRRTEADRSSPDASLHTPRSPERDNDGLEQHYITLINLIGHTDCSVFLSSESLSNQDQSEQKHRESKFTGSANRIKLEGAVRKGSAAHWDLLSSTLLIRGTMNALGGAKKIRIM